MGTFDLKVDAKSEPMNHGRYTDMLTHLYEKCGAVRDNEGKVIVRTEPKGGHIMAPRFSNGFIGSIAIAYNEHRHLVLRPDDVWLAITTALALYIDKHAEEMRDKFVEHEGKIELEVVGLGNIYSADWKTMIDQMSGLIETNTKGDVREWIEPNFSTTTPLIKTVGQVVLMGAMKNYFDFKMTLCCGIPRVTLEGTLEDWRMLQEKAKHLKTFKVSCLSHWAELLDTVLDRFVESFSGNVDKEFWSHIFHIEGWGSGPRYTAGWANVFIPFQDKTGKYLLNDAKPKTNHWCQINTNSVPPSTTEVPVKVDDNGTEYDTIFYCGHIVCVYNETDDTIRPSLDWTIVDITEGLRKEKERKEKGDLDPVSRHWRMRQTKTEWGNFNEPTVFRYRDN